MQAAGAAALDEASALLKAGERDQALSQVNKVLESNPKDARARFLKGVILAEQGHAHAAADAFQRLTQDYPALPEPYNNLAVIYASEGHYDQARVALEKSIRTHPSYATAYDNLGDVYSKLASEAYDRALRLENSDAAANKKLALVRELPSNEPAAPVRVASRAPVAAPAAAIESWRKDWESRDTGRYLAHYSQRFRSVDEDYRAWAARKRRVNAAKQWIHVGVSNTAMFRYPRERNFIVVAFDQDYRSSNLSNRMRKVQYWVFEEGGWKILYEGPA